MRRKLYVWSIFLCTCTTAVAHGATMTILTVFNGTNGSDPDTGVIADAAGNLFGTTSAGGTGGGFGTVYEIAAGTHTLSTLVNFNGSNGTEPFERLQSDAAGNLYSVTLYGGSASPRSGTVFKLAAGSHAFSTPVTFDGSNGRYPSSLAVDASGNLYGTTFGSLSHPPSPYDTGNYRYGSIFKVAAGSSTVTTLVTLKGTDPAVGNLIVDRAGNLYGTTYDTVFKIAAGSSSMVTLATFSQDDGVSPHGLVVDPSGNLYGETGYGGPTYGGTVFKIAAGSYTVQTLAAFDRTSANDPENGLLLDAHGNLFGTLSNGGGVNRGTVFRISADDYSLTTLYTFSGLDGSSPSGRLIADALGNLYGTTINGGSTANGVVYELSGTGFVTPLPRGFAAALLSIATCLILPASLRRRLSANDAGC